MKDTWASELCCGNSLADVASIEHFMALLPKNSGPVAALGAGSGHLGALNEQPLLVIESSQDMIESSKNRIAAAHLPHQLVERSSFRLPISTEHLAGLYLFLGKQGDKHPISFTLAEASRVLMTGGMLYFSIKDPSIIPQGKTGDHGPSSSSPHGFSGLANLRTLLESVGFEILEFSSAHSQGAAPKVETDVLNLFCRKVRDHIGDVQFRRLQNFYDSLAPKYDSVTETARYALPQALLDASQSLKSLPLRALDLGCANGFLGRLFRSNGYDWKFFGVDFSAEMLAECARKGEYEALLRRDLNFGIPIVENNIIDVVIACGFLEFIREPKALLLDIFRVLEQGGIALLTLEKTTEASVRPGEEQPSGLVKFHYTKDEVLSMVESSGFVVESYCDFDAYHSPTLNVWVPYHFLKVRKP